MKQNIQNAINWLKKQDIKGCITGSCLLDYFDDQDIDVFVYDEKSLYKILYAMHYNDMFQILNPIEKWKFEKFINTDKELFGNYNLFTIKFTYNTCVPVNIILKENCTNIFSVISSFDIDILAQGYDIETKQTLDLCERRGSMEATWNKWLTLYYHPEKWTDSRLLRQLERCFKYYKRGYNTDSIVRKYVEIADYLINMEDIFNSESYTANLEKTKNNAKIVKNIAEIWLKTHAISLEEHNTIRELLGQPLLKESELTDEPTSMKQELSKLKNSYETWSKIGTGELENHFRNKYNEKYSSIAEAIYEWIDKNDYSDVAKA